MSDLKTRRQPNRLSGAYQEKLSRVNAQSRYDAALHEHRKDGLVHKKSEKTGGNVNSWGAYRNWLTKVQAPEKRRSLPDAALLSWKGYRSWAERIRRDWDEQE